MATLSTETKRADAARDTLAGVVVTGAARGIGRAIAVRLAREWALRSSGPTSSGRRWMRP